MDNCVVSIRMIMVMFMVVVVVERSMSMVVDKVMVI